jgi:hypothetical protein
LAKKTSTLPIDRLEKLIARLRNEAEPRPKTKARLLAKINADFGGKLDEAGCVSKLEELVKRGVVAIDSNNKVAYPRLLVDHGTRCVSENA